MAALADLLDAARALSPDGPSWLLSASELSEQIGESILADPATCEAVRSALRDLAAGTNCDLIVGASPIAHSVVRGLMSDAADPTRALVFDVVRITGAAFAQAREELRHLDMVPAVLVDVGPSLPGGPPMAIPLEVSGR